MVIPNLDHADHRPGKSYLEGCVVGKSCRGVRRSLTFSMAVVADKLTTSKPCGLSYAQFKAHEGLVGKLAC